MPSPNSSALRVYSFVSTILKLEELVVANDKTPSLLSDKLYDLPSPKKPLLHYHH